MPTRNASPSRRHLYALFAVTASSGTLGVGCNAILGIDEGHLVPNGSGGRGGSSSVDAGVGGSSPLSDAGTAGGAFDSGAGGMFAGGSGGASSGGRGTGGAGGKGTGGAGGKATGGAGGRGTGGAGTGGASETDGGGTGGMPEPAGVPGEVRCDGSSCKLPSQVCCIETSTGAAHCATSCDSTTQLPVSCDGAEDCTTAKPKCCYPTGGTTAACMASCTGRVFCGKDADCAPGQRCAPGAGALESIFVCAAVPNAKTVWCGGAVCDVAAGEACCYDKTAKTEQCAKTCPGSDVRFACDAAEDCAVGSVCCETRTGVGLFTGTECVAGACPTGQAALTCGGANGCKVGEQCCLQGGGSGCAATCSADIVCGNNADCAAGQSCAPITATGIGTATGRTVCGATP